MRDALWQMQHRKCVYCEMKIVKAHNDVEHFRPASKYHWLAYRWPNLFYACPVCNRSEKNDEFPLFDDACKLAGGAEPNLDEGHWLVHPEDEDPAAFIGFRYDDLSERWVIAGRNDRGDRTIEALGLDRPELDALRVDHLPFLLDTLAQWEEARLAGDTAGRRRARVTADLHLAPTAPFSLLARCVLARVLADVAA